MSTTVVVPKMWRSIRALKKDQRDTCCTFSEGKKKNPTKQKTKPNKTTQHPQQAATNNKTTRNTTSTPTSQKSSRISVKIKLELTTPNLSLIKYGAFHHSTAVTRLRREASPKPSHNPTAITQRCQSGHYTALLGLCRLVCGQAVVERSGRSPLPTCACY